MTQSPPCGKTGKEDQTVPFLAYLAQRPLRSRAIKGKSIRGKEERGKEQPAAQIPVITSDDHR